MGWTGSAVRPWRPSAQRLGDHFQAVVAADVLTRPCRRMGSATASITPTPSIRRAAFSIRQVRLSLRLTTGELVDQRQDARIPPVVRLGLHEVEAPDAIAAQRTQPDARTVVQPETAARPMWIEAIRPLTTPDCVEPGPCPLASRLSAAAR
jgi:hypothetical protein